MDLSLVKKDLEKQNFYGKHFHGWNYISYEISNFFKDDTNKLLLDTFIEKRLLWSNNTKPYNKKWIGFIHIVDHNHNIWPSLNNMLKNNIFIKNINDCKCIIVLSNYLKIELLEKFNKYNINIPIQSILHPAYFTNTKFDLNRFKNDKKVIHIGFYLRNFAMFYKLKYDNKLLIFPSPSKDKNNIFIKKISIDLKNNNIHNIKNICDHINHVYKYNINNEKYEELLNTCIVFVYLYNSSANNLVVECIEKTTPLLINPLPAVKEYLGEEYPFYYNSLEEASYKVKDIKLIEKTHVYLNNIRNKLSIDIFKKNLKNILMKYM